MTLDDLKKEYNKLQYKIIEVKISEAEEKMNEMAKEGWTVASTSIYNGGAALTKSSTIMIITFEK